MSNERQFNSSMSEESIDQTLADAIRKSLTEYTYFMLAATGAAIAFALNQTNNQKFDNLLIPLLVALICWCVSFYCGTNLLKNYHLHLITNLGLHRGAPFEGRDLTKVERIMRFYGHYQFFLFLMGTVSYIGWKLISMMSN